MQQYLSVIALNMVGTPKPFTLFNDLTAKLYLLLWKLRDYWYYFLQINNMKNLILLLFTCLAANNVFSQDVTAKQDGSLEVSGQLIRQISYATGTSQSGIDNGAVPDRVLTFDKKYATSKLRITYTDNFRVNSTANPSACSWSIRIDGQPCTQPVPLSYNYYVDDGNTHQPGTLVGYCDGTAAGNIPAGQVQISVWVSYSPGYSNCDCFTGWNNNPFLLEVEEVF